MTESSPYAYLLSNATREKLGMLPQEVCAGAKVVKEVPPPLIAGAETVEEVKARFDIYAAAGMTLTSCLQDLEFEGVLTPKGRPWSKTLAQYHLRKAVQRQAEIDAELAERASEH